MPSQSFKSFTFILIAQSVAIFGSTLTAYGLGIWLYEEVGSVTIYALIAFANAMPVVLLSPIAGTVVDRINRKLAIVVSQIASVLVMLLLLVLFWFNSLSPWHIIALVALNACFVSFVIPAISATIPLMVAKSKLTQANGMIALAFGLIQLASPAISGSLYQHFGLKTIFFINIATFALAITAVLMTHIPQPQSIIDKNEKLQSSLIHGLQFIFSIKSLSLNILYYSLIAAVMVSMGIMVQPMLLALTDAQTMGLIMSFAASGLILGSAAMIFCKDVKHHMPIILTATFVAGLACLLTPMTHNIWLLTLGGFLIMASYPLFEANNRAILQRKIDPAILGRVIGWRNFSLGICQALLLIVAGLLADNFFEPGMLKDGLLTPLFGDLFGVGKGRGIAVFLSILGVVILTVSFLAWLTPALRYMDKIMEDHDEHGLECKQLSIGTEAEAANDEPLLLEEKLASSAGY